MAVSCVLWVDDHVLLDTGCLWRLSQQLSTQFCAACADHVISRFLYLEAKPAVVRLGLGVGLCDSLQDQRNYLCARPSCVHSPQPLNTVAPTLLVCRPMPAPKIEAWAIRSAIAEGGSPPPALLLRDSTSTHI